MQTTYQINLPDDVAPETVRADLMELIGDRATVEVRPAARSGQGGKLGQIDPTLFEIVIQLLDTQAAAAVIDTVLTGVGGYLLGKTGSKPQDGKTRGPDKDPG